MDFGGNLAVLEPTTVFQIFQLSHLTGKLILKTHDNSASFYFIDGALIHALIGSNRKMIGEFLLEKNVITQRQLKNALKEFKRRKGRKKIGKILIDRGYLDHNSLVSVLQEQIKELVFEVISWREGTFAFFQNVRPKDEEVLMDLRMDYLLLEGLRRMDESNCLVPV